MVIPRVCSHGRWRWACGECRAVVCDVPGCSLGGHSFAGQASLKRHVASAHGGRPECRRRERERSVFAALRSEGLDFRYQRHVALLPGAARRCAFVDFAICMPWGRVFLEVDESQHCHCAAADAARDSACAAALAGEKLVMLRFNPDGFRVAGRRRELALEDRLAALRLLLRAWERDEPDPGRAFSRVFLWYDRAAAVDEESPSSSSLQGVTRWETA